MRFGLPTALRDPIDAVTIDFLRSKRQLKTLAHHTGKEAGKDHDEQAAHPDRIHLDDNVGAVMRTAEDVPQGAARQGEEFVCRDDRPFQQIQQAGCFPDPMLPYQ